MPTFFQEPVLFSMQVLRERLSKFLFFFFPNFFSFFFNNYIFYRLNDFNIFTSIWFSFFFFFFKTSWLMEKGEKFLKTSFLHSSVLFFFFFLTEPSSVLSVNIYYVMSFRPNCFTCIIHLYLYYTLLVSHTYASYIRHWCIFSHYEIQCKSSSISNMVSESLL